MGKITQGLLIIFLINLILVGCGPIRDGSPEIGLSNELDVDGVMVSIVDTQFRESYSTYYIMNYPEKPFVYCTITAEIMGIDDPAVALNWGKNNIRLIYADQVSELAYATWSITGEDIEYNNKTEFEYQYTFFYNLPRNINLNSVFLYLSENELIPLASHLNIQDREVKSLREDESNQGTADSVNLGSSASGEFSTVGGGSNNISSAYHSVVSGGYLNKATLAYGTIGGGRENQASGLYSTVSGGYANYAEGRDAAVSGGSRNIANGYHATISGGIQNQAKGSDTTVSGGGYNVADDIYATVGGGTQNEANGSSSVVSGGSGNLAGADQAVVSGGLGNTANGLYSTVGGGQGNLITGNYSTIAGGANNQIEAGYAFAAGYRAFVNKNHQGVFLFSDSRDFNFQSENPDEFAVRATGGVRFVTGIDGNGIPASGVVIPPGGGSWAMLSDRNQKDNIHPVDPTKILDSVLTLRLSSWNYKSQNPEIRHIGPMAQDFNSAFGTGEDSRHISSVDADGIALAAIQGLNSGLEIRDAQIFDLETRVSTLEKHLQVQNLLFLGFLIYFSFIIRAKTITQLFK